MSILALYKSCHTMRLKNLFSLLFTTLILLFWGCGSSNKPSYKVEDYLSATKRDTLFADVLTYVYKRPKYATHESKWQARFRPYYVGLLDSIEVLRYHIDPSDDTHYFLLDRPVRSATERNRRVVLGKYALHEGRLVGFEEIINTPILTREEVKERGLYLWAEYMAFRHLDRYANNRDYIEFPNEGCRYDTLRKEWRYDVGAPIDNTAIMEEEVPSMQNITERQ